MGKYFGTDGFRGEAGVNLTADHAFKIGRILGLYYKNKGVARPRAVIGKDTRRSCYMLEYAIAAGLAASGADAHMLHVITTPGVSYVTASDGFDFGIMISASHNPFTDNGIKVVGSRGEKINDEVIEELEALMDSEEPLPYATGADIGQIIDYYAGRNRYIGYLISISGYSFRELSIGIDASNGGAWMIARAVFEALGAKVKVIGAEPNGLNINLGVGSTHPEALAELVRSEGLDMGFAFDGDADRCIAIDERGEIVNGDHILYILATAMKRRGELAEDTVVTTVMSNLGLYRALDKAGLKYEKTAVGDRFVYENMKENHYSLGGEQSGHIIISKYATTGDGILTAIKLTEAVLMSKVTMSELASPVVMLPQVLINLRVKDKKRAIENPEVTAAVKAAEERLQGAGRILLRESGTEPVVRVMAEAMTSEECRELAERIADVIRKNEA